MESTFQTGHEWTESNYFVGVLENNVAPVGGSLILIFIIALVYVGMVKQKSVHEFTRLFALVSSLTMVMLAFSYNLMDDTTLLRTRVNNVIAYKAIMSEKLHTLENSMTALPVHMFDNCLPAALNNCRTRGFYIATNASSTKIIDLIKPISAQIDDILNADQQNMLQDFLSLIQTYMNLIQTVIYGIFIGVATILWISIVRKMAGRYFLHGFGGFVSFICLLIGLILLFGSHGIADLCKNPMRTIGQFTTDPYVTFYFNCTPAEKGSYPGEFDEVLPELRLTQIFGDVYFGLCREIGAEFSMDNYTALKGNSTYTQECACECNKSTVNAVINAVGSVKEQTGALGAFECKVPQAKLTGLTDAICSYFSAFVGYFFLLLSLSGHAMFLFYFMPRGVESLKR